ncbi:hypothetical protein M3Y99_00504500 [Aphelenchoides fujianensis]|nr:hypothetical protein M3Y99_00504500 [Aphelenchoides fujianensis]
MKVRARRNPHLRLLEHKCRSKWCPWRSIGTTQGPQSRSRFPEPEEDDNAGCGGIFKNRTRFLLMVLVLLCLTSVWSNILAFNFALICFLQHPAAAENGTTPVAAHANEPVIREATQFTPREKGALTSAVAGSALIAYFVIVQLVNRFGIRTIFTIAGPDLGHRNPLAAHGHLQRLLLHALRSRPSRNRIRDQLPGDRRVHRKVHVLEAEWTVRLRASWLTFNSRPPSQCRSAVRFVSRVCAGLRSSTRTERFAFLLFTIFAIFYRNNPNKHPYVGTVERAKISVGKAALSKKELRNIPYKDILKTVSVWAIWIAAIGNFTCVNLLFLYSPTYMNRVLHFPFTLKIIAGQTSDKVKFLGETNKLRAYNSVAFFGSAVALTVLAFWPTTMPYVCLILFGCSAAALGFTTGGFFKAGPLVSKQFSHVVTGNISLAICITMLIVPLIVNGIAPDSTPEQWRIVFLITAGVLVVTNLLFVVMASAEPAYWTTEEFSRSASANTKNSSVMSTASVNPRVTNQ